MDNYRRTMYNRYNRNTRGYQNTQCGCGVTPVMDVCTGDHNNCRQDHMDCDHHHEKGVDDLPLAMAYVPWQRWRKVCDGATGLAQGTIFQELVLPFYGDRNCGMRGDRS